MPFAGMPIPDASIHWNDGNSAFGCLEVVPLGFKPLFPWDDCMDARLQGGRTTQGAVAEMGAKAARVFIPIFKPVSHSALCYNY